MDLFTEEQYQQLLKNGSPEYRDQDHPPVVQLTLPGTDCVWLLSELEPEAPNIAFGLCDLGMGFPELGYVDLEEIKTVRVGLFGFTIFNNPKFQGKYPMSVYASAARRHQRIVWDDKLLEPHSNKGDQPKLKL